MSPTYGAGVPETLPHGSWPTPITSELVVRAAARLGEVVVDGSDVWWSEGRPAEGGRSVIVRRSADGTTTDVPARAVQRAHPRARVRRRVVDGLRRRPVVHDFADQRLYRLDPGSDTPVAVSPEPAVAAGVRHADFVVTDRRSARRPGDPRRGRPRRRRGQRDRAGRSGRQRRGAGLRAGLRQRSATGPGRLRCWLEWNHPDMPWDATQLVVRAADGDRTVIAGGAGESVVPARWRRTAPCCSFRPHRPVEPLPLEAGAAGSSRGRRRVRHRRPAVGLRPGRFALLPDGRLVLAYGGAGADRLAVPEEDGGLARAGPPPTRVFRSVTAADGAVVFVAAGRGRAGGAAGALDGGDAEVLRPARDLGLDPAWFSGARARQFPTGTAAPARRGARAVYPPTNPDSTAPDGERPPLLVIVPRRAHRRSRAALDLDVQYWTQPRLRASSTSTTAAAPATAARTASALQGSGASSTSTTASRGARYLADAGRVDRARLAIRGGSAGGYTTLAALAFRDVFAAGASHYGVGDLEALARDTHKFESRYLDGLVGPVARRAATSTSERSPIHHVDALDRPLVVFQGLEDPVVPPDQAEMIVDALRAKGVPHAYLLFEGEQHGFRQAREHPGGPRRRAVVLRPGVGLRPAGGRGHHPHRRPPRLTRPHHLEVGRRLAGALPRTRSGRRGRPPPRSGSRGRARDRPAVDDRDAVDVDPHAVVGSP